MPDNKGRSAKDRFRSQNNRPLQGKREFKSTEYKSAKQRFKESNPGAGYDPEANLSSHRKAHKFATYGAIAAISLSMLNFAFAKAAENYFRDEGKFINNHEAEISFVENTERSVNNMLLNVVLGGLAYAFTGALVKRAEKKYTELTGKDPNSGNDNDNTRNDPPKPKF